MRLVLAFSVIAITLAIGLGMAEWVPKGEEYENCRNHPSGCS